MKFNTALQIIESSRDNTKPIPEGYMVTFEKIEGGYLTSDHFPDKYGGEDLIATEDEAWDLAMKFAYATPPEYVNIYVTRGDNYRPVKGYRDRILKKYR